MRLGPLWRPDDGGAGRSRRRSVHGHRPLLSAHGEGFQTPGAQVAAFHEQFVQTLAAGAGKYASAEAANANPLQALEQGLFGVINAPTQPARGRA